MLKKSKNFSKSGDLLKKFKGKGMLEGKGGRATFRRKK
jgi:hypothetical protein